jgi:hypothetical protein
MTTFRPEFATFLSDFEAPHKLEFTEKMLVELRREPTLFFLLHGNKENGIKFRQAVSSAIITLLENCELIQKWQGHLEYLKLDQTGKQEFKVNEPLGQFLRFLHYTVNALIESETNQQMLITHIKLATTLLHQTPYSKMLPGLPSSLMKTLVDLVQNDKM